MMNLSLGDYGVLVTIATALLALAYWSFRGRLGTEFITQQQHDQALERIEAIEKKLQNVPTHDDFRRLSERVAELSEDIAVLRERTEAVRDSQARIERQLSLFIQAQLEKERERV